MKELRKADREKERGSLRKAAAFFAKKQKEPYISKRRSLSMKKSLKSHFPMIRSKEEIRLIIKENLQLEELFQSWDMEQQKEKVLWLLWILW